MMRTAVPLCFPDNHAWDPNNQRLSIKREAPATKLVVCDEGLSILKTIETPIVVICITGPDKSGKSYILSKIQNGGKFPVHHGTGVSTTGIWITSTTQQILKNGKEARLIFLDTEGLGSLYNGANDNNTTLERKLFTLCILMSSYFIFNSRGTPSFCDVLQLDAVTSLADSVKSTGRTGNPPNPVRRIQQNNWSNSPDLLWLVRDEFRQPTLQGQPCSWVAFIKSIILRENHRNDEKERMIRKAIIRTFGKIDAMAMPCPSHDPYIIRQLDSSDVQQSDLNPAFIRSLQSTTNKIIASATAKTIAGAPVRGNQLSVLLCGYVDCLNRETGLIDVEGSWRSMVAANDSPSTSLNDTTNEANASVCVEQESASGENQENARELDVRKLVRLACTSYQTKMLELQLPCSSATFEEKHKSAVSEAEKVFSSKFCGPDEIARSRYHNELMTMIENERSSVVENNCCMSIETCEQIVENLKGKHLTPLTDNLGFRNDYDDLVSAVFKILSEYDKDAIGPKAGYVKSQAEARIKSVLETSRKILIEKGVRKSKEYYQYLLRNVWLPTSEEDLERATRNSYKVAMKTFNRYTKGIPSDLRERELSKIKLEIDNISLARKSENRILLLQGHQRYTGGIPQTLQSHVLLKQKYQQYIAEMEDKVDLKTIKSANEMKQLAAIWLGVFRENYSGAAADEVYTETKAKYAKMIKKRSRQDSLSAAVAVGGVVAAVGLAAFGIAKLFGGDDDEED